MKRRLISNGLVALTVVILAGRSLAQDAKKPNILIIWGDDIGVTDVSAYSDGLMGLRHQISIESQRKASASFIIMASNRAPRDVRHF